MAQAQSLLDAISSFCRRERIAESTFGRHAVNDGKFVSRLRDGARITPETLQRVNTFMSRRGAELVDHSPPELLPLIRPAELTPAPGLVTQAQTEPRRNFRFFDNRQKYLLFVHTCGEKRVVARRVGLELGNIHPQPPALRLFDAGMGDGTVLAGVMREMHQRFATMPFYIVGKEISLEDVRLTLARLVDRFFEHPATVLVVTNMYYTEAPWLMPRAASAARSMVWKEVALGGTTAHEFADQIASLDGFLGKHWQARHNPDTGNPVYERPVALIIYREDYRFLLDNVIPRQGAVRADYDLVIASQPYRARAPLQFKASRVIGPLVQALGDGGRLLGIHSYGHDPGLQIVRNIWPDENPFTDDRHGVLRALRRELGKDARRYNFNAYADARAIFRYDMHTLPTEISASIGTSTLFAAWNAAVYVAQIEDDRLASVLGERTYLAATQEVLQRHGGLWFFDESYVISRKRDK